MNGYVNDIEEITRSNSNFRRVLFTAPHSQLVVMSLQPGEDIGKEVHVGTDQFLRIEEGTGEAVIDGETTPIRNGSAVVVPAGAEHNIINTGESEMKLYTVYSPAQHPAGTVHETKAEAMGAEESE